MQESSDVDRSGPTLTVAAVARRLGVAPTTLRTWDRRYGLGPSARASGAHRRYTAADVARLEAMRRLVLAGVTPAEAARVALQEPVQPPTNGSLDDSRTADGAGAPAGSSTGTPIDSSGASPEGSSDRPGTDGVSDGESPGPERSEVDRATRFAGTGGRVLSLAKGTPRTRGLARAAMSLDADAVTETLVEAIASDGVIATWENVLRPLLVAVGERWEHTGEGVDVEHVIAESAARALHRQPVRSGTPSMRRPALLACAPGDTHVLPLLVLATALGERRITSLLLGAATPAQAVADAVRRCGPAAVVLWSQLPQTADVSIFEAIPRLRPPTTVFAAGRGWPEELPGNVVYASSLRHGVDLISVAVGS